MGEVHTYGVRYINIPHNTTKYVCMYVYENI